MARASSDLTRACPPKEGTLRRRTPTIVVPTCTKPLSQPHLRNAFPPEFLQALEAREDAPLAGLEAEMRGPWKVVDAGL